jgi:ERCC4-type nuclease
MGGSSLVGHWSFSVEPFLLVTTRPWWTKPVVAVVERKTLENLATSLSEGGLSFQLQRLAETARAAIVVEGDYPDLFRTQPGRGSWLADMLGQLAVRYPEVPIVFAGSRRFAEEWAYRFLAAAVADRN